MQNGKSRIKRVASAVIAGVMALQTVAPVISYADDTASSVATTDDSDAIANVDPGTPVQVDATASEEPSARPHHQGPHKQTKIRRKPIPTLRMRLPMSIPMPIQPMKLRLLKKTLHSRMNLLRKQQMLHFLEL